MVHAALDIHKRIFQAAVLDAESGELLQERLPATREALDDRATRWQDRLEAVALQATTGWRWVARNLQVRGGAVRLCDPGEAVAPGASSRPRARASPARNLRRVSCRSAATPSPAAANRAADSQSRLVASLRRFQDIGGSCARNRAPSTAAPATTRGRTASGASGVFVAAGSGPARVWC
jgi:hypothetical protein